MYHTKLSIFTNDVVNSLYRAKAISVSWSTVQSKIADLNTRLDEWRTDLHPEFDFTRQNHKPIFRRHRMVLAFFYYSTLIIINRPCLCRIDRKIPNQSDKAKMFNREAASKCVHAACDMLALVPEQPDPIDLFKISPWWCLVHYLMQGGTILMLELSFRADHMPNEVDDVFDSAHKVLKWLQSMSKYDEAAHRAAKLCHQALRGVASRVGRDPEEVTHLISSEPSQTAMMGNTQVMPQSQPPQSAPLAYQDQYDYPASINLQPSAYTMYDQFIFNNAATHSPAYTPYDYTYPTTNFASEGMSFDDHAAPGYYQGQNQDQNQGWFPGSGP